MSAKWVSVLFLHWTWRLNTRADDRCADPVVQKSPSSYLLSLGPIDTVSWKNVPPFQCRYTQLITPPGFIQRSKFLVAVRIATDEICSILIIWMSAYSLWLVSKASDLDLVTVSCILVRRYRFFACLLCLIVASVCHSSIYRPIIAKRHRVLCIYSSNLDNVHGENWNLRHLVVGTKPADH